MLNHYRLYHTAGDQQKTINGYSITFPLCPPWRLERGYFNHQKDGFNCGTTACLKFMDLYDVITISQPQVFYDRNNICRIIMRQWEHLLEYHDKDPMLLFKMAKRAKRKSIKDNEPIIENGLNFAPLCGYLLS
jgi:hypothetical protein